MAKDTVGPPERGPVTATAAAGSNFKGVLDAVDIINRGDVGDMTDQPDQTGSV